MLALLYRERGYTRAELRGVVPDYQEATTDSGFERMFERDKQELRALGFPIEEVPESLLFEDDATFRYRIPRGSFTLPPLRFTAEETAVLGLAANAWSNLFESARHLYWPAIGGIVACLLAPGLGLLVLRTDVRHAIVPMRRWAYAIYPLHFLALLGLRLLLRAL